MNIIPIGDTPAQILTTTVAGQQCRLRIVTRQAKLWLDLSIGGVSIVAGALCLNGVKLVRDAYLGLSGDLMFVDTQGDSDPVSPGLGTRFQLVYVTPDEVAAA